MRQTVRIKLNNGDRHLEADVFGNLAAHESIPPQDNLFTVTYLGTGEMLMHCRSLYRAREAAEFLAPHFDTVPTDIKLFKIWLQGVEPLILNVRKWDDIPHHR